MEIIGLSGFARVGKDEVAKILVEDFGFVRVAFADKLREMLYQLNPVIAVEVEDWQVNVGIDEKVIRSGHDEYPVYVQDVIDTYGWDGYKETQYKDEIRRLLQRLGTEAGRQTLWDTIWIDATFANINPNAKVVVTDARFYNEFNAIRSRGGYVWRVERPGVGPLNDHASETEAINYPHFSLRILNNGTLEELKKAVGHEYENKRYQEFI